MISKLRKFINLPFLSKIEYLKVLYYHLVTIAVYSRCFKKIGKHSVIIKPLKIDNAENIIIEDSVIINKQSWLLTLKIDESEPELIIGGGTTIGNFNHITCIHKVNIGKNVLTADKVYISDNLHNYEDVEMPIINQEVIFKKEVNIGEGSWIGENVSIIGCSIGRNCVVGANSVINKDIPDYCVAVGAPAKVIKRYDMITKRWVKV